MKKLILLLLSLLFSFISLSQLGMNQWRMHLSPYAVLDVVEGENAIYALLENGMMEYDLETEEITTWSVINSLSDVEPSAIQYDNASKSLLIGYENGNLDLIRNNTVYNLPFILQATVSGIKRINQIIVQNDLAYLSTGVGIVVLDINNREVKDTYHPTNGDVDFLDVTFNQDKIYAITAEDIYVASASNNFLADPSQWEKITYIPDYSGAGRILSIESFGNDVYYIFHNDTVFNGDTIFRLNDNFAEVILDDGVFFRLNSREDGMTITGFGTVYDFDLDWEQNIVIYLDQNWNPISPNNGCLASDGNYYIADYEHGLLKGNSNFSMQNLRFNGPRYNTVFRAKWKKGKLAVTCGGFSGVGPAFNLQGGASFSNEKWQSIPIGGQDLLAGTETWDFISTDINPKDTSEIVFGTLSKIPLVISKNGTVTSIFTSENSLLEVNSTTQWGYISDVSYDEKGNLWIANGGASNPLKVYTSEGEWYEYDLSNPSKNKNTSRLVIDKNNVKWLGIQGLGVVAFNDNGTISDASDDQYKVFTTNTNGGALPSSDVQAIAVDLDNNIWIGTPEGMRVFYNPSGFFDATGGNYNFQKVLIKFGEFTEIVLGTTHITSIQVDGGNRKWIGTANSGVFLLSPDGLDVLQTFTTENSPLLSNSILDIAIDHNTGEIFFVTEKGLISYRMDATQGDQEYSNVKTFPNPVHPSYRGAITIQGLAYDSDVKITDVSGKLIYKTHSNGGTVTWDGNTLDGKRAATGIYLIWSSIDDENFKGKNVGKVLLLN